MSGKGSRPRPVDGEAYRANWPLGPSQRERQRACTHRWSGGASFLANEAPSWETYCVRCGVVRSRVALDELTSTAQENGGYGGGAT